MSFRDPELLWLLLLAPVLVGLLVHGFRERARARDRFGLPETVDRLVIGRAPRLRATRGVLLVLGIMLLIVTWAGPQYGSRTRMLRKRGVDVVVALDFSKSMLAQDVRPSRIERARAELTSWLGTLGGDRVGIVAFAGDTIEIPMTSDYAALGLFLQDLGPYDMPVGSTAIGKALVASGRLLARAQKRKTEEGQETDDQSLPSRVVILITDGEDHEGDPVSAARELASQGVQLFVVGIGSKSGEPIPTYGPEGTWTGYLRDDNGQTVLSALTPENEARLAQVAEAAGGKFFRADEGSIGMHAIRKAMSRMQQQEREARKVTIAEDRYALLMLLAFLLVLLEAILPEGSRSARRVSPPEEQAS